MPKPTKSTTKPAEQYIPLTDTLAIKAIAVPKCKAPIPQNVHHIFVRDRSGSMGYVTQELSEDLKRLFRRVKKGDTITYGWFSGPGQLSFPLVGHVVEGEKDHAALDKVIDSTTSTVGLTCFSEVLTDAAGVINKLADADRTKARTRTFSLCFFTDGYPTVSPIEQELARINEAIDAIKGKVAASLLVGYGNYYNKELMGQMAQRLGAVLVHSSTLNDVFNSYSVFMDDTRGMQPRVEVDMPFDSGEGLPTVPRLAFAIRGRDVATFEIQYTALRAWAEVSPSDEVVYRFVVHPPPLRTKLDPATERVVYAAALVLMQKMRVDLALEVLGRIGDKLIIDAAVNAFTNDEYGAVERLLSNAVGSAEQRCLGGRRKNYVPPRDAYCLVDLMDDLMKDKVEFFPRHHAFDYEKIGVPTTPKGGYPKFCPDNGVATPISALTWHSEKLNLSVRVTIPGTISLPPYAPGDRPQPLPRPAELAALPGGEFQTFVHRNYSIIKDGFCHVKRLPVRGLSLGRFNWLCAHDMVRTELGDKPKGFVPGAIYVLNLTKVPVMNRAMADDLDSAHDIAQLAVDELLLEGKLKALRYFREKLAPREARNEALLSTKYSPEAAAYLTAIGIKPDGAYSPPTEKEEATDYYMAKTFALKIKGASSLPTVEDVQAAIAGGKRLTLGQHLVGWGIWLGESAFNAKDLVSLNGMIEANQRALHAVRSKLQRIKFAIILGKRWPKEFNSRTDCKVEIQPLALFTWTDAFQVSFELGEKQTEF